MKKIGAETANAIAPGCAHECIGIRPGEKIHEILISEDESHNVVDQGDMFVIKPSMVGLYDGYIEDGPRLKRGFRYSSDTNDNWLDATGILKLVDGK